jgi:hypothetical protein
MYSSELGRFISRDPVGYVDGASLYNCYFVPSDIDPFGLNKWGKIATWIIDEFGTKVSPTTLETAIQAAEAVKKAAQGAEAVKDATKKLNDLKSARKIVQQWAKRISNKGPGIRNIARGVRGAASIRVLLTGVAVGVLIWEIETIVVKSDELNEVSDRLNEMNRRNFVYTLDVLDARRQGRADAREYFGSNKYRCVTCNGAKSVDLDVSDCGQTFIYGMEGCAARKHIVPSSDYAGCVSDKIGEFNDCVNGKCPDGIVVVE